MGMLPAVATGCRRPGRRWAPPVSMVWQLPALAGFAAADILPDGAGEQTEIPKCDAQGPAKAAVRNVQGLHPALLPYPGPNEVPLFRFRFPG